MALLREVAREIGTERTTLESSTGISFESFSKIVNDALEGEYDLDRVLRYEERILEPVSKVEKWLQTNHPEVHTHAKQLSKIVKQAACTLSVEMTRLNGTNDRGSKYIS